MKTRTKKFLASGALAVSLGALALGVAGVGPALATSPVPLPSGGGDTDLSASTETGDWCGWYMTEVTSTLVLVPVNGETTYVGEPIDLTVTDPLGLSAFVGGTDVHDADPLNCSWYGNGNKQAVAVSVEAGNASFDAESDPLDASDTSMNFSLDSNNPLTITVAEDLIYCNGFSVTDETQIFGPDTSGLTSTPIESDTYTAVDTTDRCDWDVTYTTRIPGGLVPKYGGTTYVYTGPTLTTTLEIIETAPTP